MRELKLEFMKPAWLKTLQDELTGAKRVVLVGVGNPARGDDAAGVLIAQKIEAALLENKKQTLRFEKIDVVIAEDVIENYTGKIRKLRPTHIIIVDACMSGNLPGAVSIVDQSKIDDGEVSTHRLPLTMAIEYFKQELHAKTVLLGIEPQEITCEETISAVIKDAIETTSSVLCKYFSE